MSNPDATLLCRENFRVLNIMSSILRYGFDVSTTEATLSVWLASSLLRVAAKSTTSVHSGKNSDFFLSRRPEEDS